MIWSRSWFKSVFHEVAYVTTIHLYIFALWITKRFSNMPQIFFQRVDFVLCNIWAFFPFQFDLVCDKAWITATVTTIQMGGLLVGCFTMGHLADFVGRKPVYFISLFILCGMNIVAYFSVSWQMFAIVRFVLGIGAGAFLTVYFPLMNEFISQGARPVVAGLPSWTLWASLLGLASYLLPNWKHLHLATAIVTAPWLLTWWWVKVKVYSYILLPACLVWSVILQISVSHVGQKIFLICFVSFKGTQAMMPQCHFDCDVNDFTVTFK